MEENKTDGLTHVHPLRNVLLGLNSIHIKRQDLHDANQQKESLPLSIIHELHTIIIIIIMSCYTAK